MALVDAHARYDQIADRLLRVENRRPAAVPFERAGVADLSAGLGVKRRGSQHRIAFTSVVEHVVLLAVDEDRFDSGGNVGEFLVADKLDAADFLRDASE